MRKWRGKKKGWVKVRTPFRLWIKRKFGEIICELDGHKEVGVGGKNGFMVCKRCGAITHFFS